MEHQHLNQTKKAICLQQSNALASSNRESALAQLTKGIAQYPTHPIEELQGAIGNRAVNQLLARQPTVQAKPMFRGWSSEFRSDLTQMDRPIQAKEADSASVSEVQTENKTGLPDNLKVGIENLSGIAMDDVRVHKNSSKPSQLQALAYTQGTDIHVAPGQEQHLPHEVWHVVQQKQGRVKPTIQTKGVGINDDEGLEKEADKISSYWNHSQVRVETDRVSSIPSLPVNSNYDGVCQLKGTNPVSSTDPVSSTAENDYSEWKKEIKKWIDERYPQLSWIDKEQLEALMLEEAIKYAAAHAEREAVGEREAIGESEIASDHNEEDKQAPDVFDPSSSGKPSDEVPTQTSQIQPAHFRGRDVRIGSLDEPETHIDQELKKKLTQPSFLDWVHDETQKLIKSLADSKKELIEEIQKKQIQKNSNFENLLKSAIKYRKILKNLANESSQSYKPIENEQSQEQKQVYEQCINTLEKEILEISPYIVELQKNDKREHLAPINAQYPYAKRVIGEYRQSESQRVRYEGKPVSNKKTTYYIPPEELKNYEIAPLPQDASNTSEVKIGYANQKEKLPLDTTEAQKQKRSKTKQRSDVYIFAMSPQGNVYVADQGLMETKQSLKVHHSSFLSGKRVAGVGELKFEKGKLVEISDQSGHYEPELVYIYQALQQFEKWGITLKGVKVKLYYQPIEAFFDIDAQDLIDFCKQNKVGSNTDKKILHEEYKQKNNIKDEPKDEDSGYYGHP